MTHKPIGIDLGTTYSAVATLNDKSDIVLLQNLEGNLLTPSVIFFESESNIVVGDVAKDARAEYPDQVSEFVKRWMGQTKEFRYLGRKFTPTELSAIILKKLKHDAEAALGGEIKKAVITCPAYFGPAQRDATKKAAAIAGIDVLALINEPTAAALAFGVDTKQSGVVMVFDLGGGTFDVTLVRISENSLDILASDGNHQLGGKDFDDAIINLCLNHFKDENKIDLSDDNEALGELRQKAQKAKHDLSARESTSISIRASGERLRYELTRQVFDNAIQPLVEGMQLTMINIIDEARIQLGDISDVLLVGGSTRVPAVRQMLTEFFGKEPNSTVHPDEAVARGAALFAVKMLAEKEGENISDEVREFARELPGILEIVPHSIGVTARIAGRMQNSIVLSRGNKIPAEAIENYQTASEGQSSALIVVNQGEDTDLDFVRKIGEFTLELPEPRPAGSPIKVEIKMDESAIIHVTAIDVQSEKQKTLTIRYTDNLDDAEVAESMQWLNERNVQ
jgi:molecular chaperone DnaK